MSQVSRSEYQKLAEENKRLLNDIRILTTEGFSMEKILMIKKWRESFEEKDKFKNWIKGILGKN